MHTKGILIMTPDSAMVLTGKMSLDYSGGVSAEDNFGLGGYDRVMGPNGEAQYWAPNLTAAPRSCSRTTTTPMSPRASGTRGGRRRPIRWTATCRPSRTCTRTARSPRSGRSSPPETNKDRKKPFDIRTVINAIADQDHATLERWAGMADADTSVVVDAHLGGYPVVIVGIESRNIPRRGFLPADGPDQFTSGTLFPKSSKKTARAINAASGSRPLVVLANLSGFDGSPESLRNIQLEYGAEIGRAIVNFDGPIVFCVVSRYHGGAFVVFSGALNDNMEVIAVEGSFASVIGGAPAAAVVFTRDVNTRTANDQRLKELEAAIAAADDDAQRGRAAGRSSPTCGPRCARRSSARWPPSSSRSTTSNAPARSVRCTPSSRPAAAALPDRGRRAGHGPGRGAVTGRAEPSAVVTCSRAALAVADRGSER